MKNETAGQEALMGMDRKIKKKKWPPRKIARVVSFLPDSSSRHWASTSPPGPTKSFLSGPPLLAVSRITSWPLASKWSRVSGLPRPRLSRPCRTRRSFSY